MALCYFRATPKYSTYPSFPFRTNPRPIQMIHLLWLMNLGWKRVSVPIRSIRFRSALPSHRFLFWFSGFLRAEGFDEALTN